MIGAIARRFFGSANERFLKTLQKDVDAINALEVQLEVLSDAELQKRTPWLKERLKSGESTDEILVDAFATVREAAKRSLGQRHYDVQLLGGIVLHRGMITEMKTGERRIAYESDVTYATNNELGFDYLRDNMKFTLEEMVQRPFNFAIVDEVDSILIDEARTPLIISGPTEDAAEQYTAINKLIPMLSPKDYEKDEKVKAVTMTETGTENVEQILRDEGLLLEGSMYDMANISLVHHTNQALRAHILFERDTDYIVKDNKVIIIDEFTGRMMEGRRYSDGLHQALEAKEGVEIQNENQTLASITFQNYFRLYPKLAGMTGTAMTEAGEFSEIYDLEVVDIPTNVTCIREDMDDEVYRTAVEKDVAILKLVKQCQKRQQPVLVGTVSIEKSEHLSALLKKDKIKHSVLNARHHEQEAMIIARAGEPGSVTIATNMAGRGTDIQLGGNLDMLVADALKGINEEAKVKHVENKVTTDIESRKKLVLEAGGLYIVGTERHESRRIDNQLRGRAGRQGDLGASKFFLSLEDDLMRIFGSERIDTMLQKLGLEDGEAIVHPWVNKALEKAQQKVEARNFEIRKNLLKFDDVMNDQRGVIFEQRKELMASDDVSEEIKDMREQIIEDIVARCIPEKAYAEQWDTETLHKEVLRIFGRDLPIVQWAKEEGIADAEIRERLTDFGNRLAAEKVANYGVDVIRSVEKNLLLQMLDQVWKDHLLTLDHLRQGIGLRAYAQRDPLNEYKRESFNLFEEMLDTIRERLTQVMSHIELQTSPSEESPMFQRNNPEMTETRNDPAFQQEGADPDPEITSMATPIRSRQASTDINPEDDTTWGRIARNAICPCGSKKKYKHCHGRV